MSALLLFLAVTDAALAVLVFLWFARPELAAGLLARLSGRGAAWDEGRLEPAQEAALVEAARHSRLPLLVLLFLYSFACGVLIAVGRL
ncbi:MAG: hypothetical protein H6742_02475 [Alphaproteobacteria bacterium]|nr:hypothetical protein [Alphaproteobacteria bacterium]